MSARIPVGTLDDMAANRNNVVAVRLDDDEHARWKTATSSAGLKQIGQWVRETIEAGLQAEPGSHTSSTTGMLRAQAQALNKIARELERIRASGQAITEADMQRIEAAVIEAKQAQPE